MKSLIKPLGIPIFIGILSITVFYVGLHMWGAWHDEWSGYNYSQYVSDGVCNIAVIPVTGEITTFSGTFDDYGNELHTTTMSDTLSAIGKAEEDPYIYGMMALIDSGGGSPSAGEFIAGEFKKSEIPVAAYIFDIGASTAYLAATGADTIIASPFSDVGSIGITMSYLDYTRQNASEGIQFISLSSAKFKDYGTPEKPLTTEERALLERDLEIYHNEFVKQVAENRDMDISDVHKLADGSSMPGSLALEAGLIDSLGDKETVRKWFAQELGIPSEEVVFCQ